KESDEESADGSGKEKDSKEPKKAPSDQPKGQTKSEPAKEKPPVVIDLDAIANRVISLPIESGTLTSLTAGNEGQIYYIRRLGASPGGNPANRGKGVLKRFDLKTREEETLADGIDDFRLSADRKKLLYRAGDIGFGPIPGLSAAGPVVVGI